MIDIEFLKSVEGYRMRGYVPEGHRSGVTVGIGIDLGQQSLQKLKEAGVAKEVLQLLEPYIGKRGLLALETLKEKPLRLSKEVTDDITTKVIDYDLRKLIVYYNRGATTHTWEELEDRQQTVILSVVHQYGIHGAPKFLRYAMKGNWEAVERELQDFGDSYKTRRMKEYRYLTGGTNESLYKNG